jgi:hypothetical protein
MAIKIKSGNTTEGINSNNYLEFPKTLNKPYSLGFIKDEKNLYIRGRGTSSSDFFYYSEIFKNEYEYDLLALDKSHNSNFLSRFSTGRFNADNFNSHPTNHLCNTVPANIFRKPLGIDNTFVSGANNNFIPGFFGTMFRLLKNNTHQYTVFYGLITTFWSNNNIMNWQPFIAIENNNLDNANIILPDQSTSFLSESSQINLEKYKITLLLKYLNNFDSSLNGYSMGYTKNNRSVRYHFYLLNEFNDNIELIFNPKYEGDSFNSQTLCTYDNLIINTRLNFSIKPNPSEIYFNQGILTINF